jgi:hypothetical protein
MRKTLKMGLFGLAGLGVMASGAGAAEMGHLPGIGGSYQMGVTSIKEARFKRVIKQQYDFSCGSAALATLLSYHYETPVAEQDVFVSMYDAGDEEKIRSEGFSLLDMKTYLERSDFKANGYRISLDKLMEVGVPAVVLINTRGYRHFVVVKGLRDNEILVGDPALGAKIYSREEFEPMWNGIVFVITDRLDVAKRTFNDKREWLVRHKAPFGSALSRNGLASFTMLLRGPGDF